MRIFLNTSILIHFSDRTDIGNTYTYTLLFLQVQQTCSGFKVYFAKGKPHLGIYPTGYNQNYIEHTCSPKCACGIWSKQLMMGDEHNTSMSNCSRVLSATELRGVYTASVLFVFWSAWRYGDMHVVDVINFLCMWFNDAL